MMASGGTDRRRPKPKYQLPVPIPRRRAWNKGRIVGVKRPLKPKQVWAIRIRLEMARDPRDLALFNLAIDSKLRGCDLVRIRVSDLMVGASVRERVTIVQSKTQRPVQFEVTKNTRKSIEAWVETPQMRGREFLLPSRFHDREHISTRQYARLVEHGFSRSASIPAAMARTLCGERRLRRYKRRLGTAAWCSFFSAIRSWTARSAI